MPLIITHGWPGSIVEFMQIIEPLTNPSAHGGSARDAFHVVAPSLPGVRFSGPIHEAGWDTSKVGQAWAELMRRPGYQRYGAQGGDTGAIVSPELGRIDAEHVNGVHANGLTVFPSGDPALWRRGHCLPVAQARFTKDLRRARQRTRGRHYLTTRCM